VKYLSAFLDARKVAMRAEEAHEDTSRVDSAQRVFLNNGNLDLNTPLSRKVYGDPFKIS
jgi:chitosanase